MKQSWKVMSLCLGVLSLGLGLLTVGCGGGGSSKIRFVNASPNSPAFNVLIDSKNITSGLGFGYATRYQSVSSGSRNIEFEPVGTTTAVITGGVPIAAGTNNTFIAENFLSSITGHLYQDNVTAPAAGNFQLRVINAAASVTGVDIYVVPRGTDITSVSATASNVTLGSAIGYLTMAAGAFDIYFTQPNFKNNIYIFTSITFAALQNRTIVGLSNPNGGFTAITLADLN
jgi:hypothetical protein